MFPPVGKPLQPLLSPPNHGASPIYTLTSQAVSTVVPIASDLHQRSSFMRTRGRSATPPCPTISLFSYPGTSHPLFFTILSEVSLTCLSLSYHSFPRLRLVLFSC